MKNNLRIFGNEITRLLCSLAIIFIAFAHSAPIANAMANANINSGASQLTAYTLPDGTVPDFCFNSGEGFGEHALKTECEFCRIAGEIVPPNLTAAKINIVFINVEIAVPKLKLLNSNSIVLSVRSLRGPPNLYSIY